MSKRTLYALIVNCLLMSTIYGSNLNAQQIKSVKDVSIKIKLDNVDIIQILHAIEAKTDFEFSFNKEDLNRNFLFTGIFKNSSVADVLLEISKQTDLKFKQVNNNIYISKKSAVSKSEESLEVIIQGITITGRITDDENEGLPGVNVIVKGTSHGSVTDVEGYYKVEVQGKETLLVFSSVGFIQEEVIVGNQTVIDLVLTIDLTALDEIIVVGYGNQERSKVTGAVEHIKSDQLRDLPVSTVAEKLVGQAAGVVVSTPSGKPGANPMIRIRGQGSLGAGDNALVIIDGLPVGNQIPNALNPDDIESITVLKDASSTAIYGARGSNGVILITTKSASEGTNQLEYNTYFGFQNVPDSRRLDMLNAREYASFMKETLEEQGGIVPDIYQNPDQYGEGTDWIDELLVKNALTQNHNLTYSAGNDKIRGVISGGYLNQEGILPNTNFERYSLRTNVNGNISDNIKVGLNFFTARTYEALAQTDGAGGAIRDANQLSPLQSPYDENGDLVPFITEEESPRYIPMVNPIFRLNERDRRSTSTRVNAIGFLEIDFLKDFSYKLSFGVNYGNSIYEDFKPSTIGSIWRPPPRIATAEYRTFEDLSWNLDNLLNYTKTFNNQSIGVLLGYTAQKYDGKSSLLAGQGFPNDDIHTVTNAETITHWGNGGTQWSLAAYFARFNYEFKDKYLFQTTFRQEGSSRFGKDNKWGTFPSVSVGWRLSEESFFRENRVLNDIKIRASYGLTGNNNIGNYRHLATMGAYNYVFNDMFAEGQRTNSFSNSNLGWEKSRQFDLGMDLAFLENRLLVTMDYYTKSTEDMLFNVPIPSVSGFQNAWTNTGQIKMIGVEFTANSRNIVGEFTWNTNFNIAYNQHEVTDLNGLDQLPPSRDHITTLGGQVGELFGYKTLGFYNSQDDLDNFPGWGGNATGLGAVIYEDVNGDGVISPLDKTVIGDPHPDFTFGMTNSFAYKSFDFSVLMTGATGYQIYNVNNNVYFNLVQRYNVRKEVLERWRSPDDQGAGLVPTSTINARSRERTDKWLEKGDHLWIKNITLGYSLPKVVIEKVSFIKSLRGYLSVQNAFLFSYVSESNPEVSSGGGVSGNSQRLGVNDTRYPIPRIVTLGLNVIF